MKLTELINRFQLCPCVDWPSPPNVPANLQQAAVLIGISDDISPAIWLTQRPLHMKHHPGQVSFPGGKVESYDKDIYATAAREAQEEIGLLPQHLQFLGKLPNHQTHTGFDITPVVALIDRNFQPKVDQAEVSACFTLPLQIALDKRNFHQLNIERNNINYRLDFLPYKQRLIWGATGAILQQFLHQIRP
ncbi:CoA pyrophosphatase [Paraferrimonas sp. SM1919]|uniref:CoA pyrophosphatase n=1 Tax=Paraferrimonas sp. SM1919 TaxID=2662263 RepID=UPI0013D617DF|nr:CoA pyrophosphatase [Paraferrimonas sp. SM1919]